MIPERRRVDALSLCHARPQCGSGVQMGQMVRVVLPLFDQVRLALRRAPSAGAPCEARDDGHFASPAVVVVPHQVSHGAVGATEVTAGPAPAELERAQRQSPNLGDSTDPVWQSGALVLSPGNPKCILAWGVQPN
jgi:hypothetical protein